MRFHGDGDAVGAPHTELPAGPGPPIPYINTVLSQCCANGETEAQREVPVQGHKAGRAQARIQDSGFRLRRWLLCRANVLTILPLDEARSEGDTGALGLLLPPEPLPPHGALGLPRGPSRPAGLRWLTGVLPKDCVAHELEKPLGIEAGAVDRHRVLEESWGCPGAEGASTNSWRQPWTDAVCVRGAPSVSKGSRWLHVAVASWEGLTEQGTVAPSGEGDWVPGNGWKLFRQRPIRIFDFFNQL